MLKAIKDRLVGDAGRWWRWWSLRFNAVGFAILSWVQFDPVGALHVWNMMPPQVRAVLPQNFLMIVGLILIVLSMLSRVVKQPKAAPNG
jgi:hypothetical protein